MKPNASRGVSSTAPAGLSPRDDHYSYSHYADPRVAERFDTERFGGPIGALIAKSQAEVLVEFLGDVTGRTVVDVGTGTGRAAILMAQRGAKVTGVDASQPMLAVAEERAAGERISVTWALADAHALAFPEKSFHAAVCLRVLMHAPDWRQCLGELCRISRERVVFDYPALVSVAAAQAAWRRMAHASGKKVEPYRVFSDRAIRRELAVHGYRITATHRQFVLPIAVHKRIGSVAFTRRLEAALAAIGLLRSVGSPVTVLAERCAS